MDATAFVAQRAVVMLGDLEDGGYTEGEAMLVHHKTKDAVQALGKDEFDLYEFVAAVREVVREEVVRLTGKAEGELSIDIEAAIVDEVCVVTIALPERLYPGRRYPKCPVGAAPAFTLPPPPAPKTKLCFSLLCLKLNSN